MPTLLDFFEAAPTLGLPHKALLEVRKLPRRLALDEVEDLVEYAADLRTLEEVIAPSGAALFARANDPTKARSEANSRLRSSLKAYLASMSVMPAPVTNDADWDLLHGWVEANEGFPDQGARFEVVPDLRAAGYAWFALERGRTRWRARGGAMAPSSRRRWRWRR